MIILKTVSYFSEDSEILLKLLCSGTSPIDEKAIQSFQIRHHLFMYSDTIQREQELAERRLTKSRNGAFLPGVHGQGERGRGGPRTLQGARHDTDKRASPMTLRGE